MLLAGDIGGTKTLLGLFSRAPSRPAPMNVQSFPTADYGNLSEMVDAFLSRQPGGRPIIDGATFGVAGPVIDDRAELTNVGWVVDGREVAIEFGLGAVHLLNDLVAIAHSISVLQPEELDVLQEGRPSISGNAGLVAAGTGLGESYLFNDGRRLVPAPSEAGHSDFAARTPRELELSAWLIERHGRPELEQVVSGIGLGNLYAFTHPKRCADIDDISDPRTIPPLISRNAFAGTCACCREALDLFVSAYGAECGNLALRAVTTRGLYVGGGIAPKILPALETGAFLESFRAKAPMRDLLETIPVKVILNPQAGLLGAAVYANAELAE
jgi:glucokinase